MLEYFIWRPRPRGFQTVAYYSSSDSSELMLIMLMLPSSMSPHPIICRVSMAVLINPCTIGGTAMDGGGGGSMPPPICSIIMS